jgi:hypothetical protein
MNNVLGPEDSKKKIFVWEGKYTHGLDGGIIIANTIKDAELILHNKIEKEQGNISQKLQGYYSYVKTEIYELDMTKEYQELFSYIE